MLIEPLVVYRRPRLPHATSKSILWQIIYRIYSPIFQILMYHQPPSHHLHSTNRFQSQQRKSRTTTKCNICVLLLSPSLPQWSSLLPLCPLRPSQALPVWTTKPVVPKLTVKEIDFVIPWNLTNSYSAHLLQLTAVSAYHFFFLPAHPPANVMRAKFVTITVPERHVDHAHTSQSTIQNSVLLSMTFLVAPGSA